MMRIQAHNADVSAHPFDPYHRSKATLFDQGAVMRHTPQRIGYIRVSTDHQNFDRQINGLKERCDKLFEEHISAVAKTRPVFEAILKELQSGDTFIVWDMDRAFRSTLDAINIAEQLRARGIHFQIVTLHMDTTTAEGELFYTIAAAFSQYERRMIARRTREGMEAARKRGQIFGRPRLLNEDITRQAHDWIKQTGYPVRYVAALLGVSRITLQRTFKRYGFSI